jgi:hypothetical protein
MLTPGLQEFFRAGRSTLDQVAEKSQTLDTGFLKKSLITIYCSGLLSEG